MNYRHAFHAGNPVDCAKHSLLVALLDALARKPAPYAYIETHAGRGSYALDHGDAVATGEATAGIQRLRQRRVNAPLAVAELLALVDAENPGQASGTPAHRYPGSPLIAVQRAREGDRTVLCEAQPAEATALERALQHAFAARRGFVAQVEVRNADGWRELKALVPPRERRGLVLIDPPYEQPNEFRVAADGFIDALTRWPSGIVALWYPLKDTAEAAGLERRVGAAVQTKTLRLRFNLRDDGPGLLGCGLLVANPPFRFDEEARAVLEFVHDALASGHGGTSVAWLVAESHRD
jgi:23S rRNA (adenine2030-N6)-methyltransferase